MKDSEKIRQILEILSMNSREFALELGHTNAQVIYNILQEKNGISKKMVRTILQKFPDVPAIADLLVERNVQIHNRGVNIQAQSSKINMDDKRSRGLQDEITTLKAENTKLKQLVELLEREIEGYRNRENVFINLLSRNEATKP